MADEDVTSWSGASGAAYRFFVFALDAEVPSRSGLYLSAKKNDGGAWVPLFIGTGDLARRGLDGDLLASIRAKGATHVHLRLMSRDEDRADECRDLLTQHAQVFAPEGCQPEGDRPVPAVAETPAA